MNLFNNPHVYDNNVWSWTNEDSPSTIPNFEFTVDGWKTNGNVLDISDECESDNYVLSPEKSNEQHLTANDKAKNPEGFHVTNMNTPNNKKIGYRDSYATNNTNEEIKRIKHENFLLKALVFFLLIVTLIGSLVIGGLICCLKTFLASLPISSPAGAKN